MTDDAHDDIWLPLFESQVRTVGPEAAFRAIAKVAGEPIALAVRNRWERKVNIIQSQVGPATLRRTGILNWYTGPGPDDRFWPALRKHLLETKGWSQETVDSLDSESTAVMRSLPHSGGEIDIKGLVVGYVQSGKTANYTALIAKAADVGYRLIIVLAGVHNGLRRQTQLRLQEELIEVAPHLKSAWHTLTHATEDFRGGGTNTDAFLVNDQRILLVVKKNYFVLDRLVKWLQRGQAMSKANCPALIIDDEADQAGLNTGRNKRSAINERILALKKELPRSAYVGYTATPFANVLIDPNGEDLYPEDFIVALRKPKGYFGTEFLFGRDVLDGDEGEPPTPPDMFRIVDESEIDDLRPASKGEVEGFSAGMPPSLATAIRYFLLATAARWVRGHRRKHSSMLVHTALNTTVHGSLRGQIEKEVAALRKSVRKGSSRNELEAIWLKEHPRVQVDGLEPVAFDEIWEKLPDVLSLTKVVEDNGQSTSRLLYKEEKELNDDDTIAHIAIGGNTLSRGLTLEGLVVSYFVRSASAYDTLLQMGRWFGYRFGYQDLPRLWMTEELREAFVDLATIEEEIRQDIARYEREGLTPRDFAVRIRTHPTLAVTSRLKMQHAVKAKIDYSGFTRQTRYFENDAKWLEANWRAAEDLFDAVATPATLLRSGVRHQYVTSVPVARIRSFIERYKFHEDHDELQPELLLKYIDAQVAKNQCTRWTVGVISVLKPSKNGPVTFGKLLGELNPSVRTEKSATPSDRINIGTLTTQEDFDFDLGPPPQKSGSREQTSRPPSSEPLLLFYPVSRYAWPQEPGRALPYDVLGVALAFPGVKKEKGAENYIHVELRQPHVEIDEEEITPDEDDG